MARPQSQRLDCSCSQNGASGSRSSEKRDMSALRRYEILLPRRFNDGTAVPDELLADTATELREKFGAMSWTPVTPTRRCTAAASTGSTSPRAADSGQR